MLEFFPGNNQYCEMRVMYFCSRQQGYWLDSISHLIISERKLDDLSSIESLQ